MGFDRRLDGVVNLYDEITITMGVGKHENLDQQIAIITVLGTLWSAFSGTHARIMDIYGFRNGSQNLLRLKLQI